MANKSVSKRLTQEQQDRIISRASAILEERAKYGPSLNSPSAVREYFRMVLAPLDHEAFGVAFLSTQNAVIEFETMFHGTINQTSVHPREVIKAALRHNAAAVIFSHNHPSGLAEPSRADEVLTQALKQALALVDVKVLDHFVVTRSGSVSFAERGLL